MRALPPGSLRSNRHLDSKLGQPCREQALPLTTIERRSAFAYAGADGCLVFCFVSCVASWPFEAGAAEIAKAIAPATRTAAAILVIGLNILSPMNPVEA